MKHVSGGSVILALKGIKPSTPCQIVREYTCVYAAVSPLDGTLDSLILPDVDADSMSIFLSEVSERHLNEMILMFMDQAGWHRAKTLVIPENIKLLTLPPYSPELNPTEHRDGQDISDNLQKILSGSLFLFMLHPFRQRTP